jgi:hypothetical protein
MRLYLFRTKIWKIIISILDPVTISVALIMV